MKRPSSMLFIIAAAVAFASCPSGHALAQAQAKAPPQARHAGGPAIDLEFPGGTVAQYVDALRKVTPEANVVVITPEVLEITLPPVQLKSVGLGDAVFLMEGDYEPKAHVHVRIEVNQIGPWDESQRAVFQVSGTVVRKGRTGTETHVWTVADLLAEGVGPEAVLTAVETALALYAEDHEPAQVRFHEETGLLIARGDPWQVEVIDDVVDGVREGRQRQRESDMQKRKSEADTETQQRVTELEEQLHARDLETERMVMRLQAIEEERDRLQNQQSELLQQVRQQQDIIRALQAEAK
ncbi:MAG TPA: hypothetical protein VM243_02890 [Phycisphaerae bacterium]|nr:hypothetical protein [Phycisphaerae bacterium]